MATQYPVHNCVRWYWETTGDIHAALAAHQGGEGPSYRLLKLSEEVGEVVQAYIGTRGANKRKGEYANPSDVATELCDVIITAMVALEDYVSSPTQYFEFHLREIANRVERDGS